MLYVCSSSLLYDRRWRNLLAKQFSCNISDPWNPLNSLQHWKSALRWKLHCPWQGTSRQNLRSIRKNSLSFSPGCACFSIWSWRYRSSIFHFSSCPPLGSLNLLDLSTSFHLRLPGRFAYCSLPWREQPLESLNWLTATLLFRDQLVALKWAALCRCHSSLAGKNSLLPQNPGPLPMLAVVIYIW